MFFSFFLSVQQTSIPYARNAKISRNACSPGMHRVTEPVDKTMQARTEWKYLRCWKNKPINIGFYSAKLPFKIIQQKLKKCCQETFLTRNVKRSSSERRKMLWVKNSDLPKERKSFREEIMKVPLNCDCFSDTIWDCSSFLMTLTISRSTG